MNQLDKLQEEYDRQTLPDDDECDEFCECDICLCLNDQEEE